MAPPLSSPTFVLPRTTPSFLPSLSVCNFPKQYYTKTYISSLAGKRASASEKQRCVAMAAAANGCAVPRHKVVLTREAGKNGRLMKLLGNQGISCLELPLIRYIEGPDVKILSAILCDNTFDWIVITSPEAGLVFLDSWKSGNIRNTVSCISNRLKFYYQKASFPNVQVAVVGSGTARIFENIENSNLLNIGFQPSKATGRVLARELPKLQETCTVLYPASMKASNEIERGLSERGFKVMRLNTYSTVPVHELDETLLAEAISVPVVAVASPSAIRAWADVVSVVDGWNGAVACIGETSASAARESGFQKIYYPENPGLEGWVESIMEALRFQDSLQKVLTY